jgi:D-serine dehydratase
VDALTDHHLTGALRNLPGSPQPDEPAAVVGAHVRDLLLPTLTLRRSALEHNARLFARWCAENGVDHAPHGKTTMAPQLFRLQLDAGAWAITAATVAQARLMWQHGVRRVLLANQVVDPVGLGWIASTMTADPDFELFVLVDSVAGVKQMEQVLDRHGFGVRLKVLLEIGATDGRTGVRTLADALSVSDAVGASHQLELAGVECFEGIHPPDRGQESLAGVDAMVGSLVEVLEELDRRGAFGSCDEVVVTGGGSGYPDRVAAGLTNLPPLGIGVRRVVRSGCYLTHDHGRLGRCSPLAPESNHPLGALRPAMQLWAYVTSVPEDSLALCGFGKRDAPYDVDLPVLLGRAAESGQIDPLPDMHVEKLNDQHAFVRHREQLEVADLLVFGLSHPCTAFEKWPLIPVLDDSDHVVDFVWTYF